ncbi:50S ribosomal protein L3 [Candidatus Woesearchaeota archaeon]|nr:50S ribosomal protein L3 [Candidatus Woesearchaeota archaeon]
MQFWPRKRSKRAYARIKNPNMPKEAKPGAFAGYKVGMTQISFIDNKKTSQTKGTEISWPVTIIECPPLKVMGIKFYKDTYEGKLASTQVFTQKQDKEVKRKTKIAKKTGSIEKIKPEDFDELRLIVHTNPKQVGIAKKKPEICEVSVGGSKEEKLAFAKEKLGQDINFSDVFEEGAQLTTHVITKGKGYQGPVKRFGIGLTSHKSEKTKRGPGSLGGWKAQGHFMYRIAFAGKMGYHQRTEYNKQLLKISENTEEINAKGGFKKYGLVKNPYILIKGSIGGPAKRLVMLTESKRPSKKIPAESPNIENISIKSQQGK